MLRKPTAFLPQTEAARGRGPEQAAVPGDQTVARSLFQSSSVTNALPGRGGQASSPHQVEGGALPLRPIMLINLVS